MQAMWAMITSGDFMLALAENHANYVLNRGRILHRIQHAVH